MNKVRVGVLISGRGSNLQALIDACNEKDFPAQIVLVISNKQDAFGLKRAEDAGIKTLHINHKNFISREEFDKKMDESLIDNDVEFVCMAGFMRLLSAWFTKKWAKKIINIHPSLLPDFKGLNAQKQALDAGAKEAGCTVHFVTEQMDEGPVIVQKSVLVQSHDDVDSLSARILVQEHIAYKEALEKIASEFINERNSCKSRN